MQKEEKNQKNILEDGTYEIIQNRLQKQKEALQTRLGQLNQERAKVFGSVETKLIANNRINTENNCIARDIITIGNISIFGYNVHLGLRTEVKLDDVFSIYAYDGTQFVNKSLDFLENDAFTLDFTNLYKYYRNTIFSKLFDIPCQITPWRESLTWNVKKTVPRALFDMECKICLVPGASWTQKLT